MEPAFDLVSIRRTLKHGIERGLWTMEDLDNPPPGYKQLVDEMSRHRVVELRTFKVPSYKNPLRDAEAAASVSLSDPRDFTPAPGHTPALDPPAPLSQPSDDHRPPAPTQPVSVTDDPVDPRGITVYTNADDPDLWF